jgi:hypothetical protein
MRHSRVVTYSWRIGVGFVDPRGIRRNSRGGGWRVIRWRPMDRVGIVAFPRGIRACRPTVHRRTGLDHRPGPSTKKSEPTPARLLHWIRAFSMPLGSPLMRYALAMTVRHGQDPIPVARWILGRPWITGCSEKGPSVPSASRKAFRGLRLPFAPASAHVRLQDRVRRGLPIVDRRLE